MSLRKRAIDVIGVPFDLGAAGRGSRMGPDAFRCAGLLPRLQQLGCQAKDLGDVVLPGPRTSQGVEGTAEDIAIGNPKAKYLREIVRLNKRLCRKVSFSHREGHIPLVIGGDHSLAVGSLAGTAQHYKRLGVIWFDAHGDLNTIKTTPTGNIHGMSLAASLGFGHTSLTNIGGVLPKVHPHYVVLIGARSLDPGEQALIQQYGIHLFSSRDVERIGMQEVIRQALAITARDTDGLHLSFDLDGLHPREAPGVGTPVPNGVSVKDAQLAMRAIRDAGVLRSADFVEANPALDLRNRTSRVGVELICDLFG